MHTSCQPISSQDFRLQVVIEMYYLCTSYSLQSITGIGNDSTRAIYVTITEMRKEIDTNFYLS